MTKRILITGGAGFIGSHLVDYLLQKQYQVTVIDDLSTGCWQNIDHLKDEKAFRVIISSAGDQRLMEKEIPEHDLVYHLASAVGVKLIMQKPVHTIESIFNTADVVLRMCARYRRRVVITSTSEVYGKSTAIPFREEDDVVMGCTEKRRWAYACAKALDEFLALAHYHETNLPVFIVRLFNTVGPRQTGQYGMVLPNFVQQALSDAPLTVYGDGTQKRCFCSVVDAVAGLARLPFCEQAAGQIINMGSQEEVSILQLAKQVIALTNSSSTIKFIPYEQVYGPGFDDMIQRFPDITRAKTLIDWQPRQSLDEIIIQVKEYYQKLRGQSD